MLDAGRRGVWRSAFGVWRSRRLAFGEGARPRAPLKWTGTLYRLWIFRCTGSGANLPGMNIDEPRIAYYKVAPEGIKHLQAFERYLANCGLEKSLLELVKMRASQINGCAYCLDMHSKDALAAGETPQRLVALTAWRETPFYTERERAALAWSETVTRISETHVPEAAFQAAREHFNETELVNLTLAITAINSWNRIAISFRSVPGTYPPRSVARSRGLNRLEGSRFGICRTTSRYLFQRSVRPENVASGDSRERPTVLYSSPRLPISSTPEQ